MSSDISFDLLNEYLKRTELAERKVEKLKALILLTDPSVSGVTVTDTTLTQWHEFIKAFPDEADEIAGEHES